MSHVKPKLKVGLIGTGFMGKTHAFGFVSAPRVFDLPMDIELHTVADIDGVAARGAARAYGFVRATADWRDITDNPEIDIVSITAPNALHKELSLAAIGAGKHVYCEKPLAPLADDAREMADAAEEAGVGAHVGLNYLCNPMFALAREMIAAGELGEIRSYRGLHAEDYMADADGPFTFRHDPAGGGALADLGSHALATAEFLLGPITEVMGDCVTVIGERTDSKGNRRSVDVDDVGRAFLRFANGASGSIEETGSLPVARCSTILMSMVQGVRCLSVRNVSTNCTIIQSKTPRAAKVFDASKPRRHIRLMACFASLLVIRLDSTI